MKVPFENIDTAVFILKNEKGCIVLDSAATEDDVNSILLPALEKEGFIPDFIVCSHQHSDHCGGMKALSKAYPEAIIGLMDKSAKYQNKTIRFAGGEVLLGQFKVIPMPGHTTDCLGILDIKNNILLSCDSLQQLGIDRFKTYVEDRKSYIKTIENIRAIMPSYIVFSHCYEPFGRLISGGTEINACLDLCYEI